MKGRIVLVIRLLQGPARLVCALVLPVASIALPAQSDEALIAVATNFVSAAEELESEFESGSDKNVIVVAGSTGRLYAQIVNGAPFNAFLSADAEHPELLEERQLAVPGSRFTYAVGRLAIWSTSGKQIEFSPNRSNSDAELGRIAIADPRLAPYGRAALSTIRNLGLAADDRNLVYGESVGQTYSFVATGNADIGLVSLSYLLSPRHTGKGKYWEVPEELHEPIIQDAILLDRQAGHDAAFAFLEFIQSDKGLEIISRSGYGVPGD